MELSEKKAILKYFKNCIEEDSKEALTIDLNSPTQIFIPNNDEYDFDEFLDMQYDENEFNSFYQTL
jgi:hypothetical protein